MRIGIDCRLSGVSHAGIGRYIENLIRELVASETAHTYVLFFSNQKQVVQAFGKTIPNSVEIVYAPVRHYTVREQLILPFLFLREKLDLLHVPHFNIPIFYPKKMVVTIHDLLWHEIRGSQVTTLPQWQYWAKYFFYLLVTRFAILRSKIIFVPAKTIRNTIESYYPGTDKKIIVTPEGVDRRIAKKSNTAVNSKKNQLLYVGSLYPHKNVGVILEALKALPSHNLVIVGARNAFRDALEKKVHQMKLTDAVTLAGYVPDDRLAELYQESRALIQPSLSEGFGLTGLEAIQLGTPVVASDIPIFHEIYQDMATFFDPYDPATLISAIRAKPPELDDGHKREMLKQYSWTKMSQETRSAYESVT